MIKNKYLNLIILGLITIPTTIATSCNKQKIITNDQETQPNNNGIIKDENNNTNNDTNNNTNNNQNEENNDNENIIPIDIENIKINWIEGFKEKDKIFLETTEDFIFEIEDTKLFFIYKRYRKILY